MRKIIVLAALALTMAATIVAAAPARAATVTFNATIDLANAWMFTPTRIDTWAPSVTPQQVAVGDQVRIDYDFGGLGIAADDVSFAWVYVADYTGGWVDMLELTGTLSFLDRNGSAIFTTSPFSGMEEFIQIGQQFNLSTGPLSFYGVRYDGLLTSAYFGAPLAFSEPNFVLDGAGFQLIPLATPIPAALPLFASALAGLGFIGWRRQRVSSDVLRN